MEHPSRASVIQMSAVSSFPPSSSPPLDVAFVCNQAGMGNHYQQKRHQPASPYLSEPATVQQTDPSLSTTATWRPPNYTVHPPETALPPSQASLLMDCSVRVSYFTDASPPQLTNPFLAVCRLTKHQTVSRPETITIQLDIMDVDNNGHTITYGSSTLKNLKASKVSPSCLLLTAVSSSPSRREVSDLRPAMAPIPSVATGLDTSSHRLMRPILVTFSADHDLVRFQRCLETFSSPIGPSGQGGGGGESRAMSNWCHLDGSDLMTMQTYFQYYGKMINQMNMLQDSVRTELYRKSVFQNTSNFIGKRVMDVGAGSGILSFFSAQAGASIVYAVEASSMGAVISTLAENNSMYGLKIRLVNRTVESLDLMRDLDGLQVDVLISEPIGTFLFNERMIESYLFARDAFLKPGGRMYPNRCRLYLAPFSDPVLFNDVSTRCAFWTNQDFYGLNLSSVLERAIDEQLRQPIVDYIDPNAIVCNAWHQEEFDLETIDRAALANMEFHFSFPITVACLVHGIAGWFDVLFEGAECHVGFSTAPWCSPTHWYQIRFLLKQPIAVNPGQTVKGTLKMCGNTQQSYFITVEAELEGTNVTSESTIIDLKDPDYRYYSNPTQSFVPSSISMPATSSTGTKVFTATNTATGVNPSSSSVVSSSSGSIS